MKKISPLAPSLAREDLAAACRLGGLKATPQRLAVLRALRAALDHPCPEALFARLKPRHPRLSLGTVYKALHQLTDAGLAREVSVAGDNRRRFDGNLAPHQHLVCVVCRGVTDHCDPGLAALPLPRRLPGFTAAALTVDVLGTCRRCAARPRRSSPSRRPPPA